MEEKGSILYQVLKISFFRKSESFYLYSLYRVSYVIFSHCLYMLSIVETKHFRVLHVLFSQFVMCNELILLETFWLINKRCTPGIVRLNLNLPGVEVALILETDEGQSIQANFTYFYHR